MWALLMYIGMFGLGWVGVQALYYSVGFSWNQEIYFSVRQEGYKLDSVHSLVQFQGYLCLR